MKEPKKLDVSIFPEGYTPNINDLPKTELDAYCRFIAGRAAEAFKNPETVAEYEQWLIKRYGKREGKRLFKQETALLTL